jgi:hypothetical protein
MTQTAGQSLFGFFLRVAGTVVAMLLAWCVYYIAGNGKTPGILVLYWIFVAPLFYFPLKKPIMAPAAVITIVTTTLIIGYELEARKIGQKAISSTGQAYLGILTFGPVRLATVVAGLVVAFFWTIFPYPISEHSALRGDLGGALYLLANYYSVVHETVSARIQLIEGDVNEKGSPGYQMQKMRLKVFNKMIMVLNGLKTYSQFVKWEIPVGGKFPLEQYNRIILSIEQ